MSTMFALDLAGIEGMSNSLGPMYFYSESNHLVCFARSKVRIDDAIPRGAGECGYKG